MGGKETHRFDIVRISVRLELEQDGVDERHGDSLRGRGGGGEFAPGVKVE